MNIQLIYNSLAVVRFKRTLVVQGRLSSTVCTTWQKNGSKEAWSLKSQLHAGYSSPASAAGGGGRACIRHGQDARPCMAELEVLVFELGAVNALATCAIAGCEVSTCTTAALSPNAASSTQATCPTLQHSVHAHCSSPPKHSLD
jgi:hypothetical protein